MPRKTKKPPTKKARKDPPPPTQCIRPGCQYFGHYYGKHLANNPNCLFYSTHYTNAQSTTENSKEADVGSVIDEEEMELPCIPTFDDDFSDSDDSTIAESVDEVSPEEARKIDLMTHGFTTQQFYELQLCRILDRIQAPHYVYKEIREWAANASYANFDFGAVP